jgi:hypothetical protein
MSAFQKNLPVKVWYLAAGVYLCKIPDPSTPVTPFMNTYGTPVLIHTGKGGRVGR